MPSGSNSTKGYVIRCVDSSNGRVTYRGNKNHCSTFRDSLTLAETYSLKGARAALAKLNRSKPENFYSIEMLGCCYPFWKGEAAETEQSAVEKYTEESADVATEPTPVHLQRVIRLIQHSKKCLDELCGRDRFEEIKINEIKFDLHNLEILLEK